MGFRLITILKYLTGEFFKHPRWGHNICLLTFKFDVHKALTFMIIVSKFQVWYKKLYIFKWYGQIAQTSKM